MEGAKFNLRNPLKSSLLYNAVRENPHGELGDVAVELRTRSKEVFRELIEQAVSNGTVRDDIDIDFSYGDVLQSGRDSLPVADSGLKAVIDVLVRFVRRGLAPG